VKIFWLILAGIGIVAAAFFLWRRDIDKAFVIAALGLVAWLLNYRAQMKEIVAAADLADENDRNDENQGDEEEDVEDD
jgi:hypothetical protein